jgi:maleylpyruvate isomerase
MKLYGYWRSSSTWRVRIALAHKRLDYERVAVHLVRGGGEQHAAAFREKNPMQQVPLLEVADGGRTLLVAQSLAILEYLEERWPEPPLLPADRGERARARQLAEMVNSGIQPLQNLGALKELSRVAPGADTKAWARGFIERGLAALEASAAPGAGAFLVGDAPSFADVVLVPQLYNARRFGADLESFPALLRAEASSMKLDAFRESHPDRQPDAEPAA